MQNEPEYLLETEPLQSDAPILAGSRRTGRVLLVDDDDDVRLTLGAVLEREGHDVLCVADAEAALGALDKEQFDVLVVDLRLDGDVDGVAILTSAMQTHPDLIGIVVTGYGSLESAISALDAGAFSYLLKPCNIEQLKAAVLRGLDKRATADALRELQQAASQAAEERVQAELHEVQSQEHEAREAAAQARERVSLLQAITTQLGRYLEANKLLKQVVQAAAQLLESPIAAVFLAEMPDGDFVLAAAEGLEASGTMRLPRDRSLAGRAVSARAPMAVHDTRDASDIVLPLLAGGKQAGSIVVAPIWDDEQPLGVIEVYTPNPRSWPQDEIELLTALAAAAGVALVNARLHDNLQRATRMRDEVLATVGHDLKSPLTTISGHAQLLRRQIADSLSPAAADRVIEGLETIHQSARGMSVLIDELMDTVRLQLGEAVHLELAPVELMALVREIVQRFVPTSRHEFIVDGPDTVVGQWDGNRLRRVLVNLISNAVKYSPEGGQIAITARSFGNDVAVSVRDTGIGIKPEDLFHIFEPFRRGRNVGGVAGDGLGLVSVKRLVELHRGTVAVESEESKGTTFTIRLPLRAATHN